MSFVRSIEVENISIGENAPVFVIAELGINHNGDKNLAKELIESAKNCGADAVKFQTFRTEEFMSDENVEYSYIENNAKKTEKMYEMFKRLELPLDWYEELFDFARKKELLPFTSVADLVSFEFLESVKLPLIKLASEDLINIDLLNGLKNSKQPIILSSGMANEYEIENALNILRDKKEIALLHCVSLYPTPVENINLLRMKTLQDKFKLITGFSDHSKSLISGAVAVGMGAKIIEKHFTLDCNLPGPDHAVSLDPGDFKIYIKNIREAENSLGNGIIEPEDFEKEASINFRRGITLAKDMKKFSVLTKSDILFQRPCPALKPYQEGLILGKKLRKDLAKGEKLQESDFE